MTRDVTNAKGEKGRKEAQYDIAIEGDDRYWRPPATILKLLKLAYGDEAADWEGKRARLYGDPDVKMKGVKVGGIRVSHLSHITEPLTASLTVARGQTATFRVDPLPDAPPVDPNTARIAELRAEWKSATPERQAEIQAQVAELTGGGQ